MKFTTLFLLTLVSFHAFSYETEPNESKNYLRFKNLSDNKVPNPPKLNIYDNNKFIGKPVISFENEGLYIKGKLVCRWYKGYEEGAHNRSLEDVKDGTPCTHPPVFINYIEDPTHLLWIELEDSKSDDYYQTSFGGKLAFIEKKSNSDFTFELSKNKKMEINRPVEQAEYEKVLQDNLDLKEYIAKLHNCFKNEDETCVTNSTFNISASYKWYINSICENDSPSIKKTVIKLGKYCADFGDPKELSKPFNKKEREKDRVAKLTLQKEFWSNFKSCFHDENPFKLSGMAYKPVGTKKIGIKLHPKDDSYLVCSIFSKSQKDGKTGWTVKIR